MELEKSPFDNHHSNSWCKQESSTDAETSGGKLEENGIFSLKNKDRLKSYSRLKETEETQQPNAIMIFL